MPTIVKLFRPSNSGLRKRLLPLVLGLAAVTAMADKVDRRRVLTLTEMEQAHVRGEMRSLLVGTQKILSSLSADDMGAVAHQARMLGTQMGAQG